VKVYREEILGKTPRERSESRAVGAGV